MWRVIQTKEVFHSPYLEVNKDMVELPNGKVIDDFFTVSCRDAAAVVALTDNGDIVLERVYRHACKDYMIELPAGTFEKDENDGLKVAQRELLEETGYVSEEWTYLGGTRECPARLTSRIHLYLANNCYKKDDQHLGNH